MRVLDDLNIVEVFDEQDQPVGPGKEGRVVITNLYNCTLPILRYELGDYVVKVRSCRTSHARLFSTSGAE